MRWKRWLIASSLVLLTVISLGIRHYLPGLVASALRDELAAQGFPGARLEVASVGLRHISLKDVSLGDGLALGDVELDAGISLLWRHAVRTVTIKRPHVAADQLARLVRPDVQADLPFDHLRIESGVIAAPGVDVAVSGTITPAAPAPLALHLEVHTAKLAIGPIIAHDVSAAGTTGADNALHGEAHAARVDVTAGDTPVALRDVHVPIDIASLAVPRKIEWRAAEAQLIGAVVRAPSGTFVAQRTLAWRADRARWQGADLGRPSGTSDLARHEHRIAWTSITGPGPLELGAGELALRTRGDTVRIERGHLRAAGGDLAMDPLVTRRHRPTDVVVHVRGLSLAELLQTIGRGRISGTGIVDGELALRLDAHGLAVTGGALHARGRGDIQVRDPEWLARAAASGTGVALHDRIAAALGDFAYSRLDAAIANGPDLQLRARGKGKRVSQTLDLTVNVRGVAAAARWAGLRTR